MSARFEPNWLRWPMDRETRAFRAYVVEPIAHDPIRHSALFDAVLAHFLSTRQTGYAIRHRPSGAPFTSQGDRFDLLTFPEAFLPAHRLAIALRTLAQLGSPTGCVHVGLLPDDTSPTHLFTTAELEALVYTLSDIDDLEVSDLEPFLAWVELQHQGARFNLGCLFAVDANRTVRVCLHTKLVRSKFEFHAGAEKNMTEGNLLSLVTLTPSDRRLSAITIQPLLCSDVLKLPTEAPNNHPIEALTEHRSCFPNILADHVDIVSVATYTPSEGKTDSRNLHWKQAFRAAFVRAASDDGCDRHRNAVFVLSNFRTHGGVTSKTPGGLSGIFVPLPLWGDPYGSWVARTQALFGHFPLDATDDPASSDPTRWVSAQPRHIKEAEQTGLGYIVGLEPQSCATPATLFGLTLTRLPRDTNRWHRIQSVTQLLAYDIAASSNAADRIEFQLRNDR